MRAITMMRIVSMLGTASFTACGGSDPGDPTPTDPAAGGIRVTVTTGGSVPDADGYVLTIDGGGAQRVDVNATVSLTDVAAGSHRLVIDDMAENCHLNGARERDVTVGDDQITQVEFVLACAASGTVRVEIVTSGWDIDSDGFMVNLSGARVTRALANAWVAIEAEEGEHAVSVDGVAPNCAPAASNPSSIVVRPSQVATVRLEFVCAATTGDVQVVVTSTGGSIDPDGYQVAAAWLPTPFAIGANGSVAFPLVQAGSGSVTLGGVQGNCTVEGGATRAVNVVAGDTVEVRFAIHCTAFARLKVTTTATGTGSGFALLQLTVVHDSSRFTAPVANNGSTTIELPFAGPYRLRVRGPFYCSAPEQSIVVDAVDIAVTFSVICQRPVASP